MSDEKDKVEPQEEKEFGRAFVKSLPDAAAAAGSMPETATHPTQKSITRRVASKRRDSLHENGDFAYPDFAYPDDDEIFGSGALWGETRSF